VAASKINPLVHYIRHGAAEGRSPHPQFDTVWYLKNNPDVAASGMNPLAHYLMRGVLEKRSPRPQFDISLPPAPDQDALQAESIERRARTGATSEPYRLSEGTPDLFELRSLQPRHRIAVVLHLYHADLWDEMYNAVGHIGHGFDLFVSLVIGASDHLQTRVKQAFPGACIIVCPNRGRDLGPFILLLRSGVLFNYELVCKLHTKSSRRLDDGTMQDSNTWRRQLIDGILGGRTRVDKIMEKFCSDPDLGMVVADGAIATGPTYWISNEPHLRRLLSRIGIFSEISHRRFPVGCIFWIRPFLLRTLAGADIRWEDFEPEPLQPDGSLAHAVERMFGLICEEAGMRIAEYREIERTARTTPLDASKTNVKVIAYYLPQFHPIPENDRWWGAGFTEWNNVTRARPQFPNHRQPRLPADLGFYDLRLAEVREKQADLARRHGVAAFCYYYYWFDGRRVLERPLDEVRISGRPDFPFIICWGNEPWTRNWDGLSRDVLLPQTYQPGWVSSFASDVAPLLLDSRYFQLDGKPMVLIYRIGHVPGAATAIPALRSALAEQGIPDVHLAAGWVRFPDDAVLPADPKDWGLDSYFEFPPHMLLSQRLAPTFVDAAVAGQEIYDYGRTVSAATSGLARKEQIRQHRAVMLGWDNTARMRSSAHIFHGATPASFRRWLRGVFLHEHGQNGDRVIFVNAWNEWAEGTYLEPDQDFGLGWLEAVTSAIQMSGSSEPLNISCEESGNLKYHWARDLRDDEWGEFLAGRSMCGHVPPPLPPEDFQRSWVGNAGIDTFREAVAFYRKVKATLAASERELEACSRLLDIGVGWGRVYRVFMRDASNIIGVDPVPECIELCRLALPQGVFEQSPPEPPFRFLDEEFDLVYLYSVFSHLNKGPFHSMLKEMSRILKPDGFAFFTTSPHSDEFVRRVGFPGNWRTELEMEGFIYVPTGGAHEAMPPSRWGWSLMSEAFINQAVADLPFEMIAYDPCQLSQTFVALRKAVPRGMEH